MVGRNVNVAVGVFNSSFDARSAVAELHRAGFTDAEIGIAGRSDDATLSETTTDATTNTMMEEGATMGVAAGAGVGALWAIGILSGAIPGIGPAIAGGILGSLLSSAAAGAAVAGLGGALIGMGIPEDEARHYDEEFRSGKTVVTVRSTTRAAEAQAILNRNSGQSTYNTTSAGTTTGNL